MPAQNIIKHALITELKKHFITHFKTSLSIGNQLILL